MEKLKENIIKDIEVEINNEIFRQSIKEKGFFVSQFLFWLPSYDRWYKRRFKKVKNELLEEIIKLIKKVYKKQMKYLPSGMGELAIVEDGKYIDGKLFIEQIKEELKTSPIEVQKR